MKRSWKAVLVVGAIVLAAGAAAYHYVLTFEPDRTRFPVRGIDASHHQGAIDWQQVARDDVAFAYVKVSEGGDHRDPDYLRNMDGAKRAGLPVGAYHFFTFCRPGVDQARNFADALPTNATNLPPVVDLEFGGNCSARPAAVDLARELTAFLEIVESRFGRPALYYMTPEFQQAYGQAIPTRLTWIRSITREPPAGSWVIWQYHPAGHVAGIDGKVDLNVISGSLDSLIAAD